MSDISVEIDGGGLSFSGKVTLRQAIEMVRIASMKEDELTKTSRDSSVSMPPPAANAGGLSLREIIDLAAPKTSPETIAVIGSWLMDEQGLSELTRQDIRDRYQDARLPAPGNYPRDFSGAVQKGFLAPTKSDKNKFYVTRRGRKLLEGTSNGS